MPSKRELIDAQHLAGAEAVTKIADVSLATVLGSILELTAGLAADRADRADRIDQAARLADQARREFDAGEPGRERVIRERDGQQGGNGKGKSHG